MNILKYLKRPKHIMFLLKQIIVPLLIMIFAVLVIAGYSFFNNKAQIQSNAYSALKYYSYHCESGISNIINSVNFLQNDTDFINTLQNTSGDISSPVLYSVRSTLKNFENVQDIIDSVTIINASGNYVLTSDGRENFDEYFSKKYCYKSYNSVFWRSIKFLSNSQHRVYAPSLVTDSSGNTKNIIPIAFKKIDTTNLSSLLLVNISLDALLNADYSDKYTLKSDIYVLNKLNGNIFSKDSPEQLLFSDNETLYNRLIAGEETFTLSLDGYGKSTVVAVSESDSLIGYTYFAIIPFKTVFAEELPFFLIICAIIFFFFLWAFFIAYRNTIKISKPIEQIADILKANSGNDLFEDIKKSSFELSHQNTQLSGVLPFAIESYLMNYLNSNEPTNASIPAFLRDSLPFEYNLFKVIVLKILPTGLLYKDFNADEFSNFKTGFYDIVEQSFQKEYNCIFLSEESNSLQIIFNFDDEGLVSNIETRIKELYSLLAHDSQYLICYAGISETHKGFEGLKDAHTEALQKLRVYSSSPQIDIENRIFFDLSAKDENALFTKLVSSTEDEILAVLENINSRNTAIDSRSKKQLYIQILNIVFRVMRLKGVPFEENKFDFEVFSDLITKNENEIYNQILTLVHRIAAVQSSTGTISGDDKLIKYLNQNFTNVDLSLDSIASEFNTTPSYVSAVIKQKLGINFSKYISNLRITEAMRLLEETKKPISDILVESGFNSKQAFYRTFKSIAGMTPSEYRVSKKK